MENQIIVRTKDENEIVLLDLIDAKSCIDKIIHNISYSEVPDLNSNICGELCSINVYLSKLINEINESKINILKPAGINYFYYKIYYFHSRQNRGHIYLSTNLDINKCKNEDEFLKILVSERILIEDFANNITSVTTVDKKYFYSNIISKDMGYSIFTNNDIDSPTKYTLVERCDNKHEKDGFLSKMSTRGFTEDQIESVIVINNRNFIMGV